MTDTVAIYTRISDDLAGQGLGVARQEADCRALAGLRGWTVAGVYEDNDVSAFKRHVKRPRFEQLLADLAAGKVGGVVAYDLDRFARQPADLERAIAIFDDTPGLRFATVQGDIDLASADGRTMARVMVAFANKSSMDTSRRVTRKHLELAHAGVPVGGSRPFGWLADRATLDPAESDAIRAGADYLLAGGHVATLMRRWNDSGLRTPRGNLWHRSPLKLMLQSPRLAGYRVHRADLLLGPDGSPVRGLWEPILAVDTWQALRARLAAPTGATGRRGGRKYLLSGIALCGACRTSLRGNANARHATFTYACDRNSGGCGAVAVSGPALDRYVTDVILANVLRTPERRLEPWPGGPELDDVEARIRELMFAYARRELQAGHVFPAVQQLEDEAASLRLERDIYGARSGPAPASTIDAWELLDVEGQREVVEAAFVAVIVRKATRKGGRFDAQRVDLLPRAHG